MCPFVPPTLTKAYLHVRCKSHGHQSLGITPWCPAGEDAGQEGAGWQPRRDGGCSVGATFQGREAPVGLEVPSRCSGQAKQVCAQKASREGGGKQPAGGSSGCRDRRGTTAPIFIFGDFLHQELHSPAPSQSPRGQNPGPGTAFWGQAGRPQGGGHSCSNTAKDSAQPGDWRPLGLRSTLATSWQIPSHLRAPFQNSERGETTSRGVELGAQGDAQPCKWPSLTWQPPLSLLQKT